MLQEQGKENQKKLIILTGPTAVGKTGLSIQLAKAIDGEIISADSMQVYKYMDIGSAKITKEEMEGVPHHLIDLLMPWEDFNVAAFKKYCLCAMDGIYKRGHIPILVGGTGFYIQAILRDIDFTENEEDTAYRRKLSAFAEKEGADRLHAMLYEVDAASAQTIPPGNVKRVIRALEYFQMTGEPISVHNERERAKKNAYDACYFVLNDAREMLYERIEKRVEQMLDNGLVEEVERLRQMGCKRGNTAMQGIGYKEILDYLDGICTLEEAVYLIKRDTRHFAKRQLTWFRREKDVIWLNRPEFPKGDVDILQYMLNIIERRLKNE